MVLTQDKRMCDTGEESVTKLTVSPTIVKTLSNEKDRNSQMIPPKVQMSLKTRDR